MKFFLKKFNNLYYWFYIYIDYIYLKFAQHFYNNNGLKLFFSKVMIVNQKILIMLKKLLYIIS